jgi:AraC family transcriptional regulator, transcriptional activator of pobA
LKGKQMEKEKSIEILNFKRPDSEKLLFEIIDLSSLQRSIPSSFHRHDFFEIIIITKGKTQQSVDFNKMELNETEILCIPQNSIHQGDFKEKLNGYILLFTTDFLSSGQYDSLAKLDIFNPSLNAGPLKFQGQHWEQVLDFIKILNLEYADFVSHQSPNILRHLLLAFCLKLNAFYRQLHKLFLTSSNISQPFFELLEKHFRTEHSADFYCKKLNCTPKKLSQILENAVGKSTKRIIIDRIMPEAKRQFIFSQGSIKEVSFFLGFEDQLYFSKMFKKHTNCTPLEFKKDFAEISI